MRALYHHFASCNSSLAAILSHPLEHLINILVLAIVISMGLFGLGLNNSISNWQQHNLVYPQAVIYLDKKANQADINTISKSLTKLTPRIIRNYKFISKAEGLAQLQHDQQLGPITAATIDSNENPLPDSFVLNLNRSESSEIDKLSMQLNQVPMVDSVQVDLSYASKINDLLIFSSKLGILIEIVFIVVLCLVVYNLIRLQMLLKSDAIHVSRLIGASDSFIMRPLIYYAVWQVTIATLVAVGLFHNASVKLNQLLASLSNLFGPSFRFHELPLSQLAIMWLILTVFTIFSVFLAVRWVFRNSNYQ